MSTFRPINPHHAVVEFVIFYEFTDLPSEIFEQFKDIARSSKVASFLPKDEPVEGYQLEIKPPGAPMQRVVRSIERKRYRAEGLEWLLRVFPDTISIHCLHYTRWQEVLTICEDVLQPFFAPMDFRYLPIKQIGMRYVDRFIFDGDPTQYDPAGLFRRDSAHLASHCFKSGTRFHCHTGWFEEGPDPAVETLHQLNIDVAHIRTANASGIGHTINHAGIFRQTAAGGFENIVPDSENSPSGFAKNMEVLHKKNGKVLEELITRDMARQIDLVEGSDE